MIVVLGFGTGLPNYPWLKEIGSILLRKMRIPNRSFPIAIGMRAESQFFQTHDALQFTFVSYPEENFFK
jgi:hypothetical protein